MFIKMIAKRYASQNGARGAAIAAVIHRLGSGANDWCKQDKSANH